MGISETLARIIEKEAHNFILKSNIYQFGLPWMIIIDNG